MTISGWTSIRNERVKDCRLFIETRPKSAGVRILNIKPKFYQGIKLKLGQYHIEISAKGYITKKKWITLVASENYNLSIHLEKKPELTELERERQRLERERQDLEQIKLDIERKRLELEKQKLDMTKLFQDQIYKPPVLKKKEIGDNNHFIEYPDGTVLDTKTGLMWATKDNGRDVGFKEALAYCGSFRGGGHTDWRMPYMKELLSLFDIGKTNRYGMHVTELIDITNWWVWTWGPGGGVGIHFDTGEIWYPFPVTVYRALPVRSDN